MKHYGIWLVDKKEWYYANQTIFCTSCHAHAVAQKEQLIQWILKCEVREFPES